MQTKKSRKPVKPVTVILYIFLIALAVIYVAPLLWMLSVSFKDNAGVMAAPFALPEVFHWEHTCSQSVFWSNGSICHCKNALEIIRSSTHIFPDRNDGSGTLYPDSAVRTFCRAGID